jgi:PBSX family phage terminase large subunit
MREFNNCNFGICGKTVGSAIKNIVTPYMALSQTREKYNIKFTRSDNKLIVTQGIKTNIFYIYGGKDESSYMLIQGITLAGILLDEVALMTKSFVEQALARCSVDGSKYWFNCNPDSPKHWFYQEWVLKYKEKNALHLHFELEDNPSLTEQIIDRYKSMYSGVFYDRYIRGLWVVAEGLVYQVFDEKRHVIDFNDMISKMDQQTKKHFDRVAQYYVSCDYGITNPFACYVWCIYNKVAYCIKEYYFDSRSCERRKTDEEHYYSIDQMIGDLNIEFFVIDPSANSFKEVISRHDKYDMLNAKNDVLNGISNTTTLLDANCIMIDSSCKKLIEEFGLYRWDDKAETDEVIKEFDHALDSLRYFCMTILRNEFDWFDWTK